MPHESMRLSPDAPSAGAPTNGGIKPPGALDIGSPKIQAFEQRLGTKGSHEDRWKRSPNVTGKGAIHLKSFHCKLTNEALEFMDQQFN